MKKYFLPLLLLAMVSCNKSGGDSSVFYNEDSQPAVRYEFGLPIDSFRVDTSSIRSGETLGGILNRHGANAKQIAQITTLDRSVFDVRSIRPGKEYYCLYQKDSLGTDVLHYFVYKENVRVAHVIHLHDSLHVERCEKPVRTQERHAEVVINSSLWAAMTNNDLPVELALELSDIYAWTIDFFGLQKGDSIRVYFEEQFVDDARIGIGKIFACDFYHANKWQKAYWFDSSDLPTPPEKPIRGYFDEQGNSLRKAFLKAPLNYKRISSRFTYARRHPIFKTVRPHTGVDYAAPAGTPVVSIGDGVVIQKGYKGGGGHTVKIRHNSTYTTAYLHLSKYGKDIAVGKHVSQGQVIGYVGSTGNSTGPHLDFRVWKGGTPIDPLKMVSPPVEPIPATLRPAFDSICQGYEMGARSDK